MVENKANQDLKNFRQKIIEEEATRRQVKFDIYKSYHHRVVKKPKPEEFAKELADIYRGYWCYSSEYRSWMVYNESDKKFKKAKRDFMKHIVFRELESRGLELYRTNDYMNGILRNLKKKLYDVFSCS